MAMTKLSMSEEGFLTVAAIVGGGLVLLWVFGRLESGAKALGNAQDAAASTVADWATSLFGANVPNPTATQAPVTDGAQRYAQTIFVGDGSGSISGAIPLADAKDRVASGAYTWGTNPALGYIDKIIPASSAGSLAAAPLFGVF